MSRRVFDMSLNVLLSEENAIGNIQNNPSGNVYRMPRSTLGGFRINTEFGSCRVGNHC